MTVIQNRLIFTTAEVARLLDVSVSAIYKAEREGRIPTASREDGTNERVFTSADLVALGDYFRRR